MKKFLWRWQSQSQWSSVVLMHSGFAYFPDRSSESWKILRKSLKATATTRKGDVIYPKKKKEPITSCGNIGRRFCTPAFKLCFCTEIGALPKLSRLNKAQPSKGKIPNWLHFSILLFASKQRYLKDCKKVLRMNLPGRSLASRRSLCQSPCSPGSRGSPRLELWF